MHHLRDCFAHQMFIKCPIKLIATEIGTDARQTRCSNNSILQKKCTCILAKDLQQYVSSVDQCYKTMYMHRQFVSVCSVNFFLLQLFHQIILCTVLLLTLNILWQTFCIISSTSASSILSLTDVQWRGHHSVIKHCWFRFFIS